MAENETQPEEAKQEDCRNGCCIGDAKSEKSWYDERLVKWKDKLKNNPEKVFNQMIKELRRQRRLIDTFNYHSHDSNGRVVVSIDEVQRGLQLGGKYFPPIEPRDLEE